MEIKLLDFLEQELEGVPKNQVLCKVHRIHQVSSKRADGSFFLHLFLWSEGEVVVSIYKIA